MALDEIYILGDPLTISEIVVDKINEVGLGILTDIQFEIEDISFEIERIENPNMFEGNEWVAQEGVNEKKKLNIY